MSAAGEGERASLTESLGFSPSVVELGFGHPTVRRVFERTGGSLGFVLSLDDDRIAAAEVEVGAHHRGFEKEAETRSWPEALPYVGRLGSGGGLLHGVAYCLAVEELAGIEVPDRAVWLRTLACELARVLDHFLCLSSVSAATVLPAAESIADAGVSATLEWMAEIFETPAANQWIQIGGVASGLAPDFDTKGAARRAELGSCLAAFERVGLANPGFVRRLRGVGRLSASRAHAWSVTGPALRAAGVPRDLRRDAPYLAYGALDFELPIAETGDAFDRVRVRIAEIRQSLSIIEQCAGWLADLGPGAVTSRGIDEACSVREGRLFRVIESSNGQLGFGIVSDGQGQPRRIRCRAPSFFHAQALAELLSGAPLDDLFPTVASMFVLMPECDR